MGNQLPLSSHTVGLRLCGFSLTGVLATLAVVGGAAGLFSYWWTYRAKSAPIASALVHTVARGEFVLDVTERGELESTGNVEVRCEVKSRNTSGTAILVTAAAP